VLAARALAALAAVAFAAAGCATGTAVRTAESARSTALPLSAVMPSRTTAAESRPLPDATFPPGSCRAGACARSRVDMWSRVAFTPPVPCGHGATCRLRMDVYAPASGGPWPVVVLEPGGPQPPGGSAYLDQAALPIAAAGAVVMVADWRQAAAVGGGFPTSFEDVACAVGVARRTAPAYGGRSDRVVLAGHSLGGWAATVVALSPTTFRPPPGACQATTGSLRPDAVVSMSGAVNEPSDPGDARYLDAFFGGKRMANPAAWQASDPFAIVTEAGAPRDVPVTVIAGGRDTVVPQSIATDFAARLRATGYRPRVVLVPSADHNGILTAKATAKAIVDATAAP
jgi:acetyl esterase/lipase